MHARAVLAAALPARGSRASESHNLLGDHRLLPRDFVAIIEIAPRLSEWTLNYPGLAVARMFRPQSNRIPVMAGPRCIEFAGPATCAEAHRRLQRQSDPQTKKRSGGRDSIIGIRRRFPHALQMGESAEAFPQSR